MEIRFHIVILVIIYIYFFCNCLFLGIASWCNGLFTCKFSTNKSLFSFKSMFFIFSFINFVCKNVRIFYNHCILKFWTSHDMIKRHLSMLVILCVAELVDKVVMLLPWASWLCFVLQERCSLADVQHAIMKARIIKITFIFWFGFPNKFIKISFIPKQNLWLKRMTSEVFV